MANIIVYNPSDADVPNRVTKYHPSAHTPDYDGEGDKLVNPDLSGVSGISQLYWKVDTGAVVEMSQAEKDAVTPADTSRTGSHNLLTFDKSTTAGSFKRCVAFVYEGSDQIGKPYEIEAIGYVAAGAEGMIRIYDKTNRVVLTSATITNTTEDKIALPIGSNWPTGSALIEIQFKRTAGAKKQKVYLNGMVIGY